MVGIPNTILLVWLFVNVASMWGPIFLIAFFFVGRIIDNKLNEKAKPIDFEPTSEQQTKKAIIYIIAKVMKADQLMTKTELALVKQYLVRHYEENVAKQMLLMLRDELKQESKNFSFDTACFQIRNNTNYSQRIEMLDFLYQIAAASDDVDVKEDGILLLFAKYTRIQPAHLSQIRAHYVSSNQYNQRNQYYRQQSSQNNAEPHDRIWARKTLGVSDNASTSEIKKQYRRLVTQYHPDKHVDKSESEREKLTAKFREINEAYELLTANP